MLRGMLTLVVLLSASVVSSPGTATGPTSAGAARARSPETSCTVVPARDTEPPLGRFRGAFVRDGAVQEVTLDLALDGERLGGTYTIAALGLFGEPLRDVTWTAPTLTFHLVYGTFECVHHPALAELVGQNPRWGPPVRLHLAACDLTDPWHREEVAFAREGLTFRGTLVTPTTPGPHAAAVVIAGSRPRGRHDGDSGWTYRGWGEALASRGLAALVYDRRGVGASEGDPDDCDLATVASDALAAAHFLRTRPEIDPKRVGLVGISQGGWTAPMAAVVDPSVAFLVLVVPPAVDVAAQQLDTIRALLTDEEAREAGITEAHITAAQDLERLMFEVAYGTRPWATFEPALGAARAEPWARFLDLPASEADLAWWRRNRYDPADTLRRVRAPVLALFAEHDALVPPATNAALFERYLREGGHAAYELVTLPGVGHGLERPRGLTGEEWRWPTSFWIWGRRAPGLYPAIHAWLAARGLVPGPRNS